MSRTTWRVTVSALGAAALLGLGIASGLFSRPSAPPPATETGPSRDQARRKLEMAASNPDLDRRALQKLADDSDRIREQLGDSPQADVGQRMRDRLRAVEIREEESRTWFEQHGEVFAGRSFAESRFTVERLMAIERVRDELGLEED